MPVPDGSSLANAIQVPFGVSSQSFTDALNTAQPNDYYRFKVAGRSSVTLALTGLSGNADVQVLDSTGTLVLDPNHVPLSSTNTGTLSESIDTVLNAGVYYIRVFQAETSPASNYTLSLQASRQTSAEIAWRNYANGDNILWTMNGTSVAALTYLQNIAANTQWRIQATGDFNQDGSTDLVWRNYTSGENILWLMNGVSYSTSLYLRPVADLNWQIQGAGDFNDDGQTDLLWRNYANGQNLVWSMQGTTSMALTWLETVADPLWQIQAVGDLNQDGQADLVWRYQAAIGSSSPGTNLLWLMNGTSHATTVALPNVNDFNWQIQGTGDFNGDGKTDLLWRNYASGENLAWFMNGTTSNTLSYLQTVNDPNWHIEDASMQFSAPTPGDAAGNTLTAAFNVGTLNGTGTYAGWLGTSDLEDYYKFNLVGSSAIDLQLNNLSGDVNLQLFDSGGNLLQTSSNAGTSPEAMQRSLNAGTYYLRVYPGVTGVNTGYTLGLAVGAPAPANALTLSENNSFVRQTSLPVAFAQAQGKRFLAFDINAQFGTANAVGVLEDQFLVYLVDGSSQTLLDQGKGTAVFALAGSKAEFTPGLVTYNGTTVAIDLSRLPNQTNGTLVFQLINNDNKADAAVQVFNLTNTVDPAGVSSPTFTAPSTSAPGAAVSNLSSFTATTALKPLLSNLHRHPQTGKFMANLQVQNTGTTVVGRQVVALFANLPAGVTLVNASGSDANGKPYLNLKPAIANGGLAAGAISDAVEITFDDPNLVPFNWQPTFLSGPANQAPVLNAIAPISLHPGEYQAIALATDPDGDFVTLSLRSQGAPPPVSLSGDGKLILNPSPTQVGSYTFTVVASDGVLETTQTVQLTVTADPVTTTRLSGVLKSAGTTPQALAGIKVEWGSVSVTTAADGSFTLSLTGDVPTTPLKVDGRQAMIPNISYPDATLNVTELLGHTPYAQANNVLNQPLYLKALDTANATTISGSGATTVSNPNGAALTVPAGVLKNAQGNPYTGQASLTPLDSAQLVAPLPDGVSGNGLIQVDLKDAVCTGSLPLQSRNPTAYRGAVDLYGQLPNGSFGIIGSGYAGADGYFKSTPYTRPDPANPNSPLTTNGVPGSGIYFFAPKALAPKGLSAIDRNPDEVCESCKVRKRLNEDATVELHSGGVMESHELPTYQSLGETRGIQLQYDSLRADPRPIVHFGYDDVQYDPVDNSKYRMIAKLTVKLDNGTTYQVPGYQGHDYGLTGGENFWLLPLTTAGSSVSVDGALQVNLRNQASGLYDYDLTTGIKVLCDCATDQHFYGASTTQKDQLVVVNSINSAFGSGWGLAGWQELVESTSGSVLLIDGNGSQLVFKKVGSGYQSPDGDFSTLYKLTDGTFQRVAKDGTRSTFNAQKKLQSVVDRNGFTTTYTYDAAGRLNSIIDPAGAAVKTTFTYYDTGVNANRVHFITDPAGRITTLAYDASGNLIQVTDPDTKAQAWGYDDQHHLTTTTDKLGTQPGQTGHTDQTFYDFAGRATRAIDKDGSVVQVKPVQVQGLHKAEETVDPFKAPVALTTHAAESDYVDANGNVTRVFLDRAQQELFSQDGLGDTAKSERNDTRGGPFKYLVTKTTDARGNVTNYTYGSKGNVSQIVAPLSQGTPATNSLFPEPKTTIVPQVVAVDWDGNGTLDLVSAAGTIAFGDGHGGFSAPVATTVTPGQFVAVGDLNQDGRLDLVTADADTLHIHLQQANGTFGTAINRAVGGTRSAPVAIGLADLDGDNDLDLFSLNGVGYNIDPLHIPDVASDNNLAIWLNNGQAGFAAAPIKTTIGSTPTATPLQNRPTAVTTGDLNHDGRLDAVVSDGANVSVLLGQSDGTFTVNATYADGNRAQAALADVNGDGQLDLVMLSGTNVLVRLGLVAPGSGALFNATATTVATASFTPSALFLKDLDGDGKLDLLVTQAGTGANVASYQGLGNGTFATARPYTLPNGYNQFLIGDFDTRSEDPTKAGTLDVLSLSGVTAAPPLLLNQGDGTFVARAIATGTDYPLAHLPTALLTADVNGDGNADIILSDTSHASVNKVLVRLGNGDGTFAAGSEYTVGNNPSAIAVGDVDKDGTLDLIIANRSDGTVSVLKGLKQNGVSTGTFGAKTDYTVGSNPLALAVGDLNGDGNLDIVSANAGDGTVSVLWGSVTGTFGSKTNYAVGSTPSAIALADLNGDTRLDLVTANTGSNTVSVLLNNGTASTLNAAVAYTVGSTPSALAIGDVTQDGKLDLVVANAASDSVSVLAGVGNGTFGSKQDYTVGSSPQSIALGDVNGDSRLDMVTANASSASVSVLLGSATGLFAPTDRFDFQPNQTASAIALADFNRDGALDFATIGVQQGTSSTPVLSVRLNDRLQIGTPIGTGHHDYVYDPTFNQLTRETDELGRVTTYALDEHGNVSRMTRVVGTEDSPTQLVDDVVTTYTYTTDGRVKTITDPNGHVTAYNYDYDSNTNRYRNLRQMTVAKGTADAATQTFEYDAAGNQAAVLDERGNRTEYHYDLNTNWLTEMVQADPDGAGPLTAPRTQYTYDANGRQLTVKDARGVAQNYVTQTNAYDALGRLVQTTGADPDGSGPLLAPVTTYTYDLNGNLAAMVDALGQATQYRYDVRNRLIETIHPDLTVTQQRYDADNNSVGSVDAKGQKTQTILDARGRRVAEFDALGNQTRFVYDVADQLVAQIDAKGQVTRFVYDDLGRQVQVMDALGQVTKTTYDQNGNVMVQTDALGHQTQYGYDGRDRQTTVTDALNHITTTTYDKVGNVTDETDALNHTTHYTYDALNRQTVVTDARGGNFSTKYDAVGNVTDQIDALNRTTHYTYDNLNRQVAVTDPSNQTATTTYDAAGNVIAQTDALGHRTQYRYDSQNRRTQVIDALNQTTTTTYDNEGNVAAITDAANHTTTFKFDALNRQTAVIDASGNTISKTTYDAVGAIATEVDALGHTTTYTYDALNRRTSVTDALGNTTRTTYDAVSNIWQMIDPDQNTTTYTYDALNRLTTDTNQLGKSRTYGYDAVGNQISLTDRNNQTRLFTYDALNRQTQEQWLGASGNTLRTIASTYNAVSELTGVNDVDATYQYTYDLNGRLKTVAHTGTSGVPSVLLTYTYDVAGNLTAVDDAVNGQTTGGTTAYAYSVLNQVTQITQSGSGVQSKRVNLGYNALGEMVSINRYADTTGSNLVAGTSYTYDALNRLTQLQHTRANGSNLASYNYGYDAASRLTQLTESNISATNYVTNYNYDATNQLSGADKPGTVADESYSYDANGNRLQTGYSTGSNNQLLSDGVYNYTYDNEGNLKTRTEMANANNVRTLTWDYRNRLTNVMDMVNGVTQQTTYTYDALNQRIAKTVGAQTTRFVYDRGNVYLEFSGTNTTPSTRYLYGPMVDQVLAQESSSNTTWLLTDHLGSVRDLVTNSGTVVNHFTYGAFGNVLDSLSGATVDTRYKYTGREFDAETGLYYYRARYYDANDGRFIGQDPLGFAAGDSNLYRYVGNSPLGATDPTGEYGKTLPGTFKRKIQFVTPTGGQIKYPSSTTTNPALNPEKKQFQVVRDIVTATIVKDTKQSKNPDSDRAEPVGGTVTKEKGAYRDEEKGHIIPNLLGGSDRSAIRPAFEDNFISQNFGVNRGAYNSYGKAVNRYLDTLYEEYQTERSIHMKKHCTEDMPKVPPYVVLTVELFHAAIGTTRESFFPLRPSYIKATAEFFQPGRFIYRTNLAQSALRGEPTYKVIEGGFTNPIGQPGTGGITTSTVLQPKP